MNMQLWLDKVKLTLKRSELIYRVIQQRNATQGLKHEVLILSHLKSKYNHPIPNSG